MLTKVLDVLRGIVLNPVLTAFARGVLEAGLMAAVVTAGEYVAGGNLPDELQPYAGLLIMILRTGEGMVDKIDAAKQRQRDAIREDPAAPGYDL